MKMLKRVVASITSFAIMLSFGLWNEDAYAASQIDDSESVFGNEVMPDAKNDALIFSVLDYRKPGVEPQYLTSDSDFCHENGLKNVSVLYERSLPETLDSNGWDTIEVFYQANTEDPDVRKTVQQLKMSEDIYSAEPDCVWEACSIAESSEEYASLSGLQSLEPTKVWNTLRGTPGNGAVVAVLDTGVDYTHPDLKENMWINEGEIPDNGVDDDNNGYIDDVYGIDLVNRDSDPMDEHGHGTHVAGIIGMGAENGGGVGLAYGAKIMAIKAGDASGVFSSSAIVKAVKYAVDNGADIINMSFGGKSTTAVVEAVLQDAANSCVLVAAAGNDGAPTADAEEYATAYDCYPAAYPYVIGVMALDRDGALSAFSNWDYAKGKGGEYEICAPGASIYSTLPDGRYAAWDGTSSAAPCVAAAAAILRGQYPDRSKYSSKYLSALLVNATTTNTGTYPVLNILDSLTNSIVPSVKFGDYYIWDDPSISEANNGDGIIQPGETIDIGFSVNNYGALTTEATVRVEAPFGSGESNPYVEFLNDTVVLEGIGTFEKESNGLAFTDGKLTGISNPIRIHIKSLNDADDLGDVSKNVELHFTLDTKNGLDPEDETKYTAAGDYTVAVENIRRVNGIISEDLVMTPDKIWIIDGNVRILKGVTVKIRPGTHLEIKNVGISVEGTLLAEGEEESPIEIVGKSGASLYVASIQNMTEDTEEMSDSTDSHEPYAELKYVQASAIELSVTKADHCKIKENAKICADVMKYCAAEEYESNLGDGVADLSAHQIMDTCCSLSMNNYLEKSMTIRNSVRFGVLSGGVYSNGYENQYGIYDENCIRNCALFRKIELDEQYAFRAEQQSWVLSGNYWGTDDPAAVSELCYVYNEPLRTEAEMNTIKIDPILTKEDDLSAIYPFMTEAYLTDDLGERIETVSSRQKVTMHIKFNRDMDQEVQPSVSFGKEFPYRDYSINGKWISPREWESTFNFYPFIEEGTWYIRSKGAVAADDQWLVTAEDRGRFSFEIVDYSILSRRLEAVGVNGGNELHWTQDEFETLAGYNLYRTSSYKENRPLSEQRFARVNSTLYAPDEVSAIDTEVYPGNEYYYYFTAVDTEFHESAPSNVVVCSPLDEEAPNIEIDPIESAIESTPLTITAEITDHYNVKEAVLYYRMKGDETWQTVQMKKATGNKYCAEIPGHDVKAGKLEYYITASDSKNTVSTDPLVIVAAENLIHYGDVNADDAVDIMDVIVLNKYLLGSAILDDTAILCGDVDQSGKLEPTDSLNILKYVVELIDVLPLVA